MSWDDFALLGFTRGQAGAKVNFKQGSQGAEIKTLTVREGLQATKGSVLNIRGEAVDCKERTVKTQKGMTPITDYTFADGSDKIKISKWGTTIEGLREGLICFAEKVTVGEYQGAKQFLATEITIVENEVTDGIPSANA